jgi:sulfotransferase
MIGPLTFNTVTGGAGKTVYERTELLMDQKGVVGGPYMSLKQAITGNEKNKLMLIEYDQLCKNPKQTIDSIYHFIGEELYEHDFGNVERNWDGYDSEIGIKLHRVKKKVEFNPRQTILPPDILQKFSNLEVWRM